MAEGWNLQGWWPGGNCCWWASYDAAEMREAGYPFLNCLGCSYVILSPKPSAKPASYTMSLVTVFGRTSWIVKSWLVQTGRASCGRGEMSEFNVWKELAFGVKVTREYKAWGMLKRTWALLGCGAEL